MEPGTKRTIAFIDGQNLFKSAQSAGFCTTPDFDAQALASEICRRKDWHLTQVRFYTGIPDSKRSPRLFQAWQAKLDRMKAHGIITCTRPLRYDETGKAREKGIDVRIALDIVRLGNDNEYDVGLIFSQDQDLVEAVHEVRDIAGKQIRWLKMASTFIRRSGPKYHSRGVFDTDWIEIDKPLYDAGNDTEVLKA